MHLLFAVFKHAVSLASMHTTKVGILTVYDLFWTDVSVSSHVLSLLFLLAAVVRAINFKVKEVFQVS